MSLFSDPLLKLELLPVEGVDIAGHRITAVSLSARHGVVLLSNGCALTIGKNTNGCLGTAMSRDATQLTLVGTTDRVVGVAAGVDFTLLATSSQCLLACGIPKNAQSPVEVPGVAAIAVAAFRNTAAVLTPAAEVVFWADFHDLPKRHTPAFLARVQTIACGDGFVAALTVNGLLQKFDGRDVVTLVVPSRPIMRFFAVDASANYVIAVGKTRCAWIFGDFAGFSRQRLLSAPVLTAVDSVFAFPEAAAGIGEQFQVVGIGRLPSGLAVAQTPIEFHGKAVGFLAGNETEIVAVPAFITSEILARKVENFVPERLIIDLPIGTV